MKVKIKVTKAILEKSKMCGLNINESVGTNCAIALAVRDLFPGAWVGKNNIQLMFFKKNPIFPEGNILYDQYDITDLPMKARVFIQAFDRYTPEQRVLLPEIEFEIEVPDKVIEEIGISEVHKILSKSSTLELV